MRLTEVERGTVTSLASTALPRGKFLPGASPSTTQRLEAWLNRQPSAVAVAYRSLLWALESAPLVRHGRPFTRLDPERRLATMKAWQDASTRRVALRALLVPLKLAYFDDPGLYAALGCRFAIEPPFHPERPRWRERVIDARTLGSSATIECDVVVVGTGAGGAPVAKALADRGLAVLMIEEGELHTRETFTGRPTEMIEKLYRNGGLTAAVGNTVIPIPVGRAVGGTTVINAATCLRAPESTLAEWRSSSGLDELTTDTLAPYYAEVAEDLHVAPSSPTAIGAAGRIIARGCDALGYAHGPLDRNAPECDGQALCCFGCPSDAKRSTNVSFVPAALKKGAQLLTGLKVESILVEGGVATGVEGIAIGPEGQRSVRVRARVVVLACGALHTPALLLRNGLCNASGQVGRNLSIHPASSAIALFDEPVCASTSVPQGYGIHHFLDRGILFEGAHTPLGITSATLSGFGPEHTELMESYERTLGFGFMIKDRSRGRVRLGLHGEPLLSYWVGGYDFGRMQSAMGILARVFFAAGAQRVHTPVAGFEQLMSLVDVDRLEAAHLRPRDMDISAYHPLGTARMGRDPLKSVVGPTQETWDVHNLFVCDGAAFPGSAGVNPQLTIMAMSLRAAEPIARRCERRYSACAGM